MGNSTKKIFHSRYAVLSAFFAFFLILSFIVRTVLLAIATGKTEFSLTSIFKIYGEGLVFDIGVATFLCTIYAVYLLLLPSRWSNKRFNKWLTYAATFLFVLIVMFAFFAEFPFWAEFESRFNFIAVDYLIYTYEVINNINQSYPLPLLIGGMLLVTILVMFIFVKLKIFKTTFETVTPFKQRLIVSSSVLLLSSGYIFFVQNNWAEKSPNHYYNELSKSGIYSFFAAFRNNELDYKQFYTQIDNKQAVAILRADLQGSDTHFLDSNLNIKRMIQNADSDLKPNIIMVTLESFSASFMKHFGGTQSITPVLDSIAEKGIFFTNMYATGTRTVRGMEALSLAIPPTPGNSIVRRQENDSLMTIGNIFKQKGYSRSFFYGGDGYFDNMNKYFGSNGFDIIDRPRNNILGEKYDGTRTGIPDSKVTFENAWGICDEDIYNAVIADADDKFSKKQNFYDFVMTTSNHRPYTYPANKIAIPSGTGRDGAVAYSDYAIGEFLKKIKNKPWFSNTIIIFVADHCASSAGKNEIEVENYHIPCIVLMNSNQSMKIDKMCSQIDLYPTLFSMLGWDYESNLFGENVLAKDYKPRALLGTYQKLAYLKEDSLVILSPQQMVESFRYDHLSHQQVKCTSSQQLLREAIAQYQVASLLYKNGGLHQ
jgi:phosphoglycerol transferase MdoB-like AlkP superfamily enzyme